MAAASSNTLEIIEFLLNVRNPIESLKRRNFGLCAPLLLWSIVGASVFASRDSRANETFLETVGISTAVGAAVGASTLPFYEKPGNHLANVLYGASAGALVGLGIWLYGKYAPGEEDEQSSFPGHFPVQSLAALSAFIVEPSPQGVVVGVPVVSLNW